MGLVFTIYSGEWNCLFPNDLLPHTASKCREDPADPKLSWTGEAQAQWSFGRSRSPKVPLVEAFSIWLPARGCRPQGEGVDKGHCSAATVTFSYADLQQECSPWPCFLGCLQHHTHTRMTPSWHTQPMPIVHMGPVSSPLAPVLLHTQTAQQPDVLTRHAARPQQPDTLRSNCK